MPFSIPIFYFPFYNSFFCSFCFLFVVFFWLTSHQSQACASSPSKIISFILILLRFLAFSFPSFSFLFFSFLSFPFLSALLFFSFFFLLSFKPGFLNFFCFSLFLFFYSDSARIEHGLLQVLISGKAPGE